MGKFTLKKTNKELSVEQENYIAKAYDGRRSPSSGAQDADRGDIRYSVSTIDGDAPVSYAEFKYTAECKATRNASISLKKEVWDKVADEASDQGRRPCMFLRFYDETTGEKLDLVVRDIRDDLEMLNG